ncbi:MAG: hypothetical protein J6S53_04475 [Lentisphaeria bacterium]|nr:hypothetical protein [Lentisphaeria bacterium]
MFELVYTSLPQGLLAGRSGFSTAALTEGFPGNLISPIENLSGYKTLFPPGHPDEKNNPVNYSCQHYRFGASLYIVLSRISFYGLSYTGRSNILAHHLLFTAEELLQIPGGPVAVLRAMENFPQWSGAPRMLPQKSLKNIKCRALPVGGKMWKLLAGNELWADYAAEIFRGNLDKKMVLSFDPGSVSGEDILELYGEIAAKLTPEEQLSFTFNTYSYSSGIANPVFLRAYPVDSTLLSGVKRLNPASIVELGKDNPLPDGWVPVSQNVAGMEKSLQNEEENEILPAADPIPEEIPAEKVTGISCSENKKVSVKNPAVTFNTVEPEALPFPFDVEEQKKRTEQVLGNRNKQKEEKSPLFWVRTASVCLFVLLVAAFIWAAVFRTGTKPEKVEKENTDLDVLLSENLEKDFSKMKNEILKNEKDFVKKEKEVKDKEIKESVSYKKEDVPVRVIGREAEKKEDKPDTESVKNIQNSTPEAKAAVTVRKTVKVKKYKAAFGILTKKELFELYKQFWKRPFSGKLILPLPLKNSSGIHVDFSGLNDLKDVDWKQFVVGNGQKTLYISSGEWKRGAIVEEYSPSENVSGQMTLKLEKGTLFIHIPPAGKNSPNLSHIRKVTFLHENGSRFTFEPKNMPAGFEKELEKNYGKIYVRKENRRLVYSLTVSGLLWDFRDFFFLKVNGKVLRNRISGKEIVIHHIDTERLSGMIRKRNKLLADWRKAEKELLAFQEKNKKLLSYPVLPDGKKIVKLAQKNSIALQDGITEKKLDLTREIADVKEELLSMDAEDFAEENVSTVNNGNTAVASPEPAKADPLKAKEVLLEKLGAFEKQLDSFAQIKDKEGNFEENCRMAKGKFEKSNSRLTAEMKSFSVKYYTGNQKELQSFLPIKENVPEVIEKQNLHEQIRIEVIRRNEDGIY